MDSDNITVKISGAAIHKAVKNFILHDESIKALISEKVKELVTSGTLKGVAERIMAEQLKSYYVKDAVAKAAREMVNAEVRGLIEVQVKAVLANSVFVMPKVQS